MLQKPQRRKETKKLCIDLRGKSVDKIYKYLKEKESKLLSEGFTKIVVDSLLSKNGGWSTYREVLIGEKCEPLEDFEKRVDEWAKKQIDEIEDTKIKMLQEHDSTQKALKKLIKE